MQTATVDLLDIDPFDLVPDEEPWGRVTAHLRGLHDQKDHAGKGSDFADLAMVSGIDVIDQDAYSKDYGDLGDEQTVNLGDGYGLTVRYFERGDSHVVIDLPDNHYQVLEDMDPESMRQLADDLDQALSADLDDPDDSGMVFDIDSDAHNFYIARTETGDVRLHPGGFDAEHIDLSEEDAADFAEALRDMADSYEENVGIVTAASRPVQAHLKGLHDQKDHGRKGRKVAPAGDGGGAQMNPPSATKRTSRDPHKSAPAAKRTAPAKKDAPQSGGTGTRSSNLLPDRSYAGPAFSLPKGVSRKDVDDFRSLAHRQEAGDELDFDEDDRLYELKDGLPPAVVARVLNEIAIDKAFDEFHAKFASDMDPEDLKRQVRDSLKRAADGKPVGVRISPVGLQRMLDAGRYKTQHETSFSGGILDPGFRSTMEGANFGLPEGLDKEKRPVYGYVMVDGVRPAGLDPETTEGFGDMLSQYGRVQVVLKPHVQSRTTMMVGDSLNDRTKGRPSPMSDPDWRSFTFTTRGGLINAPLARLDRDYGSDEFRGYQYVEAQIHGGVTVDDVAEVVFPEEPSADLRRRMESAGVSWRVLAGDRK